MPIPLFQVDAFTDVPFQGNPAAICLLHGPAHADWMQKVAREMNLAETAFLVRRHDQDGGFDLRWFTPAVEVDLCGHATLASAHVLWENDWLHADEPAHFHTRSGLLVCRKEGERISMNFPAEPAEEIKRPEGLDDALRAKPVAAFRNRFDLLALLDSEEQVRSLEPDLALIQRFPVRGVMVTAPSTTPGIDFVSRFFAPQSGIPEDPVTGSAHCCLGPFWGERLGKQELIGWQASARGGKVHIRLEGKRVVLAGSAVTVLQGELVDIPGFGPTSSP